MIAITLLSVIIVLPLALVTAFFAVELFVGLASSRPRDDLEGSSTTASIVIPAHDEAAVIARTVGACLAQTSGDYSILVVADNCTDLTADLARAAGARVVVRNDPQLRGKGFALAAARDELRKDPPSVVIVLDADCRIDRVSLDSLAFTAAVRGRPCQAINLLAPDLAASPLVQISTFAFMVKNLVRQRGLQRLADRVHLTGTGMALPWKLFADANLGDANIVEDLALGLELSSRASAPMLVAQATVTSPAASAGDTLVQRRRWEGGYLATALSLAPKALGRSLVHFDLRGMCAALDLSVPPLALLVLLDTAALLAVFLLTLVGGPSWPAWTLLMTGFVAGIAVILVWVIEGHKYASASTILRLPFYVFWKLPMYAGLVRRGAPKEWLRTGR